ncbi:cytochrome c-type biogenesis protein [Oricola sp.]|uniref:cytochrome c-type biogenesis protein n=1 Tax=Oricola sp. TaxID=1979950 RepID=UPI003BA8C944
MLRTKLRTIAALAAGLTIAAFAHGPAMAINPGEMFEDPAKEQRARDIGRNLRCMVCQNQSIFDSNASLAADLRMLVRERIEAGDNDDQVVDYISDRYGDYVLLEPPVDRHTYILWLAPVFCLLIGAGMVFAYHRGKPARTASDFSSADREAAQRILQGD